MQNQTLKDFVLMAIPSEVLEEAQIMPNALIQYHADEGKIIMEMVDEVLPLACSGECDDCPVKGQRILEKNEEITLLEFLNNLTEEQQRAALIHLSVLWAQKVGDLGV